MRVTDPVCKMNIEESEAAAKQTHQGATYHFCSTSCRDKFLNNPEAYLGEEQVLEAREDSPKDGTIYTCPMHPEVRQPGPLTEFWNLDKG